MTELVRYQTALRAGCRLSISYNGSAWEATVETEQNKWPHWQMATAPTPQEAWNKLKAFLNGGPQLHGSGVVFANDFVVVPL